METTILDELKKNKEEPCVSIIIPTHNKSLERRTDKYHLENAVQKATELLRAKYGNTTSAASIVIDRLEKMSKEIDYMHNDKGLGLFVSPEMTKKVDFPFEVEEKIVVGENFEVRDVIYLSEYLTTYYVLSLNEHGAKLLKGSGVELLEIKDANFPFKFVDDYEYARVSPGSSNGYSLKSTEKDQSIIAEIRFIANLKIVDKKLTSYLGKDTPLLISGISKELGYFNKCTTHKKYIVGKVTGNFDYNSFHGLGVLTFEKMKIYLEKEEEKLLGRLDISLGKKMAAIGIEEVWDAAHEGKGLILLVEKDFARPGFVIGEKLNLLRPPMGRPHKIVTDVVDEIMETVLEKNGRVVIVRNGLLKDFQGIALIQRFK